MTDFHDVSFPLHLAFGASGGPERFTEVTPLASGREARNTAKKHSRRKYNAALGIKKKSEAIELYEFFEARRGRLHSFRFRDPLDHSTAKSNGLITATDQFIGTGDGLTTQFQLIKSYGEPDYLYQRPITKPDLSTVKVAINGAELLPAEFTVDPLAGVIEFSQTPALSDIITAGFEFDIPVRFDTDELNIALDDFGSTQISDIMLIEVLDYV